jgi:hypothetical protein
MIARNGLDVDAFASPMSLSLGVAVTNCEMIIGFWKMSDGVRG